MNDALSTPLNHPHPLPQRRVAGALLIAGPVIYFLAEFIAAAAWTDPPYSYTYHFISNLGVRGPAVLLGQTIHSPLAWVMNSGFFLFGITLLPGVVLLRGLSGWRRTSVLVTGTMLAFGGVMLALHPGSAEEMAHGSGHALGAMAAFVGGNALAIQLGHMHRRVGLAPKLARWLRGLGAFGLISLVAYFVDLSSEVNLLLGLVERGIVDPFLLGLICAGVSIWKRPSLA